MSDLERGQSWLTAQYRANGVETGDWRRASGGLNYDLWRLEIIVEGERKSVGFNQNELEECGCGDEELREMMLARIRELLSGRGQ